jgi:hypothetical protein
LLEAPKPEPLAKVARGLLNLAGIPEPELVAFLHQTAGVDETLVTLDDIEKMAPDALKKACDGFKAVEKAIRGARK